MFLRTLSLIRKEFIHIRRDPRTLAVMIITPLMQLILLGYAANTDINHMRTAVYDGDKSQPSASRRVEKRGLSARKKAWEAIWINRLSGP
jgi:hypothetical protein